MSKVLGLTLGILTAIGGFVDIGDIVTNGLVGARYGMALAWVVLVGIVGIMAFAEMSGRVAAVTGRATFDLVRDRLGPRAGLLNLVASLLVTGLTLGAEIGGVALALQLASSVNYLLFVPVIGAAVWAVIWRVRFTTMETIFGLLGLTMVVFAVAVWQLGPDWSQVAGQALHPAPPQGESWLTYAYYAIALFGAAMTPYEVFFFSSGGVEEHWSAKSLGEMRSNVFLGFPLGGLLSLSIMAAAALVLQPALVEVGTLGQIALPVVVSLGKLGLACALIGFFATTFGSALECGLSLGYSTAQYFGWQWGKFVRPISAARFHLVILICLVLGIGLVLTTIDPVKITEYSVVFSAMALPLTYVPILLVANDQEFMGKHSNGRLANFVGMVYLALIIVVAVVTIPLMILTKAGQ